MSGLNPLWNRILYHCENLSWQWISLHFGMQDEIIFVLLIEQCDFEWGLSYKKTKSHTHEFYMLVTPSRVNKSDFRDWWLFVTKRTEKLALDWHCNTLIFFPISICIGFHYIFISTSVKYNYKNKLCPRRLLFSNAHNFKKKITTEIIIHIRLVVKSLNDGCPNIITNEGLLIVFSS